MLIKITRIMHMRQVNKRIPKVPYILKTAIYLVNQKTPFNTATRYKKLKIAAANMYFR